MLFSSFYSTFLSTLAFEVLGFFPPMVARCLLYFQSSPLHMTASTYSVSLDRTGSRSTPKPITNKGAAILAFELWCWRRLLRVPWTARRSNQSILKEIILGVNWKDWWSWNSNTLASWCEELTHLKRPWCWERLKAGREGDDRGWDGWMASVTQWTWVWVSSGSWWWTGRPGVLQSMGSQRVRHNWVTELSWTESWFTFCGGEHCCLNEVGVLWVRRRVG